MLMLALCSSAALFPPNFTLIYIVGGKCLINE
jgi:hypothetical protein